VVSIEAPRWPTPRATLAGHIHSYTPGMFSYANTLKSLGGKRWGISCRVMVDRCVPLGCPACLCGNLSFSVYRHIAPHQWHARPHHCTIAPHQWHARPHPCAIAPHRSTSLHHRSTIAAPHHSTPVTR